MSSSRHILWFFLAFLAAPLRAEPLLVFAAASLQEPLDAILAEGDASDVTVSYGGSGQLARQVLAGAPADLVILAHPQWMEVLVKAGRVSGQSVELASNTLVLVAPTGTKPMDLTEEAIEAALGEGVLAVGLTSSVPAGIYAQQALESLELWDDVAMRLAETDSVRGALALVGRGEAPLGIVYATDAQVVDTVVIVAEFPPKSHERIRYEAAVVAGEREAAARILLARITSGTDAFLSAGFLPPGAS